MTREMITKVMVSAFLAALAVAGTGCKTDCDEAADQMTAKYEECGITVDDSGDDDGEEVECTEELGTQSLCLADCVDAASCEVLKGEGTTDDTMAYAECAAACM